MIELKIFYLNIFFKPAETIDNKGFHRITFLM
ncbi:MAG: hypothetical protein RLZ95_770 [Bacteroidota bacterium]|jgi:hypothetical protein